MVYFKTRAMSQISFTAQENESLVPEAKLRRMETIFQLSRLVVFLLLFLISFARTLSAASAATLSTTPRPGFLYTRTRGRCTPQYWSSRTEAWPRMVPQTSTLSKVFGSRVYERYRSDLTLLESTTRNDDDENAFARLVKQATAALLNSYAREGFPYAAWEVKTLVIQALVSEAAAAQQAKKFSIVNEACN